MLKQEPTEPSAQETGLGFSNLSMNEIAPAVTVAGSSPVAKGSGMRWLIALAVLAVLIGGGWIIRSGFNFPPSREVQMKVQEDLDLLPYRRSGKMIETKFLSGNSFRIEFAASLNTDSADDRKLIRMILSGVMGVLHQSIPEKDLTIVGYQGDHKIADAKYTAVGGIIDPQKGERAGIDISVWVENGEEDGIDQVRSSSIQQRQRQQGEEYQPQEGSQPVLPQPRPQ